MPLVVNAGGGPAPHPLDERLAAILDGYRGPLLALHVAATLLPEHDGWERTLGGRWVRGVSMHPEQGPLSLKAESVSPITHGLGPLETVDEAYSWLRVGPGAEVLLVHDYRDESHAACWILERDGRRTAYDSLGHDAGAYAAPLPRELLRRLVRWLLASPEAAASL